MIGGEENKSVINYNYLQEEKKKGTGESGLLSLALVENLSSRKVPSLFEFDESKAKKCEELRQLILEKKKEKGKNFNIEETARELEISYSSAKLLLLQATDKAQLIDRQGKPVYCTNLHAKLIFDLSYFISQNLHKEDIQLYIKMLEEGRTPSSSITITISITELTRLFNVDRRARKRQKEKTIEELKKLAEIQQVQTFGEYGTGKEQARYIAPFITLGEQLEDKSKGKTQDLDFVNIVFGRIFFSQIKNSVAYIKSSILHDWGKRGNGTNTELFPIILSELLGKFRGHWIASNNAEKVLKDKLKREKITLSKDSYEKAVEKARRDAITYSEYTSTIQERVIANYTYREQKKRFTNDLKRAINFLVEHGLLTKETHITKTPKGERVDFVFNRDYCKQEETPLLDETPTAEDEQRAEKMRARFLQRESVTFVEEEA